MEVLVQPDVGRLRELTEADQFFWLDLLSPTPEEIERVGDALGLTELARRDTRNFDQRPKLDDFGNHVLLVLYGVQPAPDDPERQWHPLEVHLYISGSWLLTVRRGPCEGLERAAEELREHHPDSEIRVVWHAVRAIVDGYGPALDELERRIDRLETVVFKAVTKTRLEDLYHLRQETNDLLRRAAAQRDQFDTAARTLRDLPGLSQDARPLLDDLSDQFDEVAGELDRHHADATMLVQVYFNASGDRIGRLTTRLTVIATFFLAWTLVTGFFGQNFGWLVREVDSERDFMVFGVGGLLLATLVAGLVVWWYRRSE